MPGGLLRAGPAPGTGQAPPGEAMTGGARPGADVPAASQHEAAARPGDTAAGRVAVPAGGRVRPASRRGWPWVWALAWGVVAAAAVRPPGAASDVRAAFAHAGGLRLAWLGAAVAAQMVSLAGGTAAQRWLLAARGCGGRPCSAWCLPPPGWPG